MVGINILTRQEVTRVDVTNIQNFVALRVRFKAQEIFRAILFGRIFVT